jgi:hypothetical protein
MPKRIADYQFYMQHPEFKGGVMEEFKAKHSGTPKSERLKVQCEIARTKFEAETEEVKTRIREEATAERDTVLAAHNNGRKVSQPCPRWRRTWEF